MLNLDQAEVRDAVPRRLQAARAARRSSPSRSASRPTNIFKGENGLPLEIDEAARASASPSAPG